MEINRYTFVTYVLLFLLLIFSQICDISTHTSAKEAKSEAKSINHKLVKTWADKLGVDLWHLGELVTHRHQIHEGFQAAEIKTKSGQRIIEAMAEELKYMFDQKVSAVRRIMDSAQNTAMSHEGFKVVPDKPYYNAKEMLEPNEKFPSNKSNPSLDDRSIQGPYITPSVIVLTKNKRFFNTKVNTSMSSVHVPTNVFDRDNDTLWAIQWSEKLDSIFLSNYQEDPTLSWQFFGSSTGFMRQFPASKWESPDDETKAEGLEEVVDLYDCRLRSWYIEAANSPKDVIILVDISGSMTGQRKDIARHVVYNILDTLGTNDFVNIFKFSQYVEAAVPCFNNSLIQATLANVRELKMGFESVITADIANYHSALKAAFEALANLRNESTGAQCNQAIMLISDGVPYDFTEEIEKYNNPNNTNSTFRPVRIFTYLIGKEVADVTKIKDIACQNFGYYVHLSTLAEVREQVLRYVPVMARPLVLGGDEHPVVWTQAYADVIDPQMTDYSYEMQERNEQKKLFESHRTDKTKFDLEKDKRFELKEKEENKVEYGTGKFNLVTTVSMPVYDKRKNATYIANLLGVAGTDIPIKEIQKFLSPFKLGVNGYSFIVTNNGFVLTHPDLRPVFRGILKPDYNSIDLAEVELLDDNTGLRDFNDELITFRDEIVNQTTGNKFLIVKQHLDNMTRVSQLTRLYYWQPIGNTPFTLVISLPKPHGQYRVKLKDKDDIHLLKQGVDIIGLFNRGHFKIHPDWIYCRHNNKHHDTPEQELMYFLGRIINTKFQWKDRASHQCDRELVQQLVFDAWKTESFSIDKYNKDEKPNEKPNGKPSKGQLIKIFGLRTIFVATQSGLTRWVDVNINKTDERQPKHHFSENHNRAIDEVWYKRAVEQHSVEQDSFVFSVPFNADEENDQKDTLVTASHAIFVTEDVRSAPAAVAGYQFLNSELHTFFKNVTTKCGDSRDSCDNEPKCFTDEVNCYVLDNNGFVVISTKINETGKFFGEVEGNIMMRLIEENIYQPVIIYDYQGVCFEVKQQDGSAASILQVPIIHFIKLLKWFGRAITWAFIHLTMMTPAFGFSNDDDYGIYSDASTSEPNDIRADNMAEDKLKIEDYLIVKRRRLQPCDKEVTLYTLGPAKNGDTFIYDEPAVDCDRPFVVVPIPHSNLILLVWNTLCPFEEKLISITPKPKRYGNESTSCYRRNINMKRRRPALCINHHPNESLIEGQCGRGYSVTMSVTFITFIVIVQAIL